MSKRQNGTDNYLDYIPSHNKDFPYTKDEDGSITILVKNTGVFNSLAQKFLHKPEVSQIHLDEMGNFVWPLIDGQRNVNDIALLVKAEFGENAEPLYSRLVTYMKNLENYHFIHMTKK